MNARDMILEAMTPWERDVYENNEKYNDKAGREDFKKAYGVQASLETYVFHSGLTLIPDEVHRLKGSRNKDCRDG